MVQVDINCDMGEGSTLEHCAQDAQLMPFISRCNIACGGHAGNFITMQQSIKNARLHGIRCGAHPAYPDPQNFGRQSLALSPEHLIDRLLMQINQLDTVATQLSYPLHHIKLHGALYNDAEQSPELADKLCQVLAHHYPHLSVLGLAGAAMETAAKQHGLNFLREGFIDRAYLATGQLAPRTLPGAVYSSVEQCIEQVLAILKHAAVTSLDGHSLDLRVDSLCLHGDSAIALELAPKLKTALLHQGYQIA